MSANLNIYTKVDIFADASVVRRRHIGIKNIQSMKRKSTAPEVAYIAAAHLRLPFPQAYRDMSSADKYGIR